MTIIMFSSFVILIEIIYTIKTIIKVTDIMHSRTRSLADIMLPWYKKMLLLSTINFPLLIIIGTFFYILFVYGMYGC